MPPPPAPAAVFKPTHSRNPSNVAPVPVRSDSRASKKPDKQPAGPEVHYTLLIRLPFPRGDFVDPPQVEWDAVKDQALWEIISRSSKTSELDWEELASNFNVPHAFILQQAAWLYERHLSHVRAQVRKVAPATSSSPAPGATSGSGSGSGTVMGGVPMKRLGSGGSRAPSALSTRSRDSPVPRVEGGASGTGTPRPSQVSRNPSTTTITQSRITQPQTSGTNVPPSPRQPIQRSFRSSLGKKPESAAPSRLETGQGKDGKLPPTASALSATSSPASPDSDESSSSEDEPVGPPGPTLDSVDDESRGEDDEDDEDSGTFLPFANAANAETGTPRVVPRAKGKEKEPQDLGGTLKEEAQPLLKGPSMMRQAHGRQASLPGTTDTKGKAPLRDRDIESSISSASSLPQNDGAAARMRSSSAGARRKFGPLSPHHRAELARLSPRRGGSSSGQAQGSEGTPSMGSSFSDLDDASISQSALEEALLSKMNHGGLASRMSTLSQAVRSKYL
ncbi:hypothetical protein NA57DRAFT_70922 [Rhizodiscina lignyota]|uniref:Autophagy-related protein 29 n=1 Tax=Rhizodiscina lignyota TaxID=1504668 RepID=A0A9P4ISR7_9PEZI|nr:hypothetical protein NA57DRAFT_70922 [Rhizodiscina lignyota]